MPGEGIVKIYAGGNSLAELAGQVARIVTAAAVVSYTAIPPLPGSVAYAKLLKPLNAAPGGFFSASPPDRSDGYTLPPHLIQSVTEQDLYEGMVCLGMLECPVLQEADCEKAFENVKDCVGSKPFSIT